MVGITAFTQEIMLAAHIIKEIKANFNIGFSVIGGVHATFLSKQTLEEFDVFDLLVFGEGEYTLAELIKKIRENGNNNLDKVKGLTWRLNGNIVVNPARPVETNLDKLPLPSCHLLKPASNYRIQTTRGCPYSCHFCSRSYGNEVRNVSPKRFAKFMDPSR